LSVKETVSLNRRKLCELVHLGLALVIASTNQKLPYEKFEGQGNIIDSELRRIGHVPTKMILEFVVKPAQKYY